MAISTNPLISGVFSGTSSFLGIYDYNDTFTAGTPIAFTAAEVKFTNNALGSFTNLNFPAGNIQGLWNSSTNFFNFSSLPLGSLVNIRLDFTVTTTAVNQIVNVLLRLGIGVAAYDLPFPVLQYKSAGSYRIIESLNIYIGDAATKNGTGAFFLTSDNNCTTVVHGWAVQVGLRT